MSKFLTKQEQFWAGKFGNQYNQRNIDKGLMKSNIKFFKEVLKKTKSINSIIEFGANVGLNLVALKDILPNAKMSAIEINDNAVDNLKKNVDAKVYHDSIYNFEPDYKRDLVLIKTVLIHINPKMLNKVYDLLYETSGKYICISEYYSPTPVIMKYRGHDDRLFKRDFAGEMLNRFKDLKLVDYGFKYHREDKYYDDNNWFLLKKS